MFLIVNEWIAEDKLMSAYSHYIAAFFEVIILLPFLVVDKYLLLRSKCNVLLTF